MGKKIPSAMQCYSTMHVYVVKKQAFFLHHFFSSYSLMAVKSYKHEEKVKSELPILFFLKSSYEPGYECLSCCADVGRILQGVMC